MNRERSTLSPEHRHLTNESIIRIQITLSSRKSSVVVFNTYARLVAVGNGRWDSVAVGAPCILLVKETSAPDSRFQVRLAIAEVESGISVWEEEIGTNANYTELQPTFHTFTADGQSLALQFADAAEASSLIDCLNQYMQQKKMTDRMLESEKKGKGKKSKKGVVKEPSKRVSKFDISSPCEFRHLSGITAGQTSQCEQELEGTIMRRQRSASMSAIASKNAKQRGRLPKDMVDGDLYSKSGKENSTKQSATAVMQTQPLPPTHNNQHNNHRRGIFKSSSVRVGKRKPIIEQIKNFDDSSIKSTPSHSTSSQEHSYWTIDDLRNASSRSSANTSPDHEPSLTFKNSAPSQIHQAWRNSASIEDGSSKSSRSSTPHHGSNSTGTSPTPLQPLSTDKKPLTDRLPMLTSSPAHMRLNTSPDHQPTASTLTTGMSLPHVVAAANAKKYLHVKPTFNTYDTLLPLAPNEKLPPLAPVSTNTQKVVKKPDTISEPVPTKVNKPASTKPTPFSIRENGIVTPPAISSPGDLDVLSQELSKVLKDFDDLITPNSPLVSEPTFQYAPTNAKETMV